MDGKRKENCSIAGASNNEEFDLLNRNGQRIVGVLYGSTLEEDLPEDCMVPNIEEESEKFGPGGSHLGYPGGCQKCGQTKLLNWWVE